jgi:hypothetical protein
MEMTFYSTYTLPICSLDTAVPCGTLPIVASILACTVKMLL